jgi:peptidoglycan/LPS O-acetylase OafA/YrhL
VIGKGRSASAPDSSLPLNLATGLAKSHLPSLDGLRAISALLVVFYHYGFEWCPGGLGVLAFFVLSGFLITWLLLKEEERSGAISLRRFYMRRSLRIFPAFYTYWLLLSAALLLFHKRYLVAQALASFFYVNNYYQAIHGDPNTGFSHTWSLAIEEQFYLLWPITFLVLKRNQHRIRFLLAGILAVMLYREVLIFILRVDQGYIYEAFDARADQLLIGCLLAVALRQGAWSRFWRWLCSRSLFVWATIALLAVSSALAAQYGSAYRDAIGFVIDPILVAALIAQTIAWPAAGAATALNWGWMRYLGTISYSIYLYQQVIVGPVEKLVGGWPAIALPATVLAVIAAASASYWIIERPFLRVKDRFERS